MQTAHRRVEKTARMCAVLLCLAAAGACGQLPRPKSPALKASRDHWHNDDGSTRYNFEFGGGPAAGIGPVRRYQTFGGAVAGAAGVNFNHVFTLQARGEYDKFGVPASLLKALNQPDGNVQMASGTLTALVHYYTGPHLRLYFTVGGGYYRRVTTFVTTMDTGNQTSATVTTGQFHLDTYGESAAFGFEWKGSFFSNAKLFTEARYNYVHGQRTGASGGTTYDFNSRNMQYIPVVVGVRW